MCSQLHAAGDAPAIPVECLTNPVTISTGKTPDPSISMLEMRTHGREAKNGLKQQNAAKSASAEFQGSMEVGVVEKCEGGIRLPMIQQAPLVVGGQRLCDARPARTAADQRSGPPLRARRGRMRRNLEKPAA